MVENIILIIFKNYNLRLRSSDVKHYYFILFFITSYSVECYVYNQTFFFFNFYWSHEPLSVSSFARTWRWRHAPRRPTVIMLRFARRRRKRRKIVKMLEKNKVEFARNKDQCWFGGGGSNREAERCIRESWLVQHQWRSVQPLPLCKPTSPHHEKGKCFLFFF